MRTTRSEPSDDTPVERLPHKPLDDLRRRMRRLELVAYAAFAIAVGLLAGAIAAIGIALGNG